MNWDAIILALINMAGMVILAFIARGQGKKLAENTATLDKVEVNTNSRLTTLDAKLDTALKGVSAATGEPLVSVKDAPTEVQQ